MKTYRRADGFEVCDEKDRSISWAQETYGGSFIEIVPPPPLTDEQKRVIEIDKELKEIEKIEKVKERKESLILEKANLLG